MHFGTIFTLKICFAICDFIARLAGAASGGVERTVNNTEGARMTQCSVLRDMQLCTTVEALDRIADDHRALQFQGLLVLENILGPSHPETTQQVFSLILRC